MTVVRSRRRTATAWTARVLIGLVCFAATLWIVVESVPYQLYPGDPTISIVASTVMIAGLAAEELVGADVRRKLGI